jgi:hypothetical protein
MAHTGGTGGYTPSYDDLILQVSELTKENKELLRDGVELIDQLNEAHATVSEQNLRIDELETSAASAAAAIDRHEYLLARAILIGPGLGRS